MDISFEQAAQKMELATLTVAPDEAVHILHPNQIVAFQGSSYQREDSLMKLVGMYRKKRMIQSKISGPARLMLGLPAGYSMTTLNIRPDEDLLFEFRHVLFYTEGMTFRTQVQTVRNTLMTRDFVKMRFQGPGTLGLMTTGALVSMDLDPEKPLYVDINCLVAYPQHITLKPCVYGNALASQYMNYQWELTGTGQVLLKPSKPDRSLDEHMQSDGLVRRVLREIIPFGGVFIK